jgi:hypothetical protein
VPEEPSWPDPGRTAALKTELYKAKLEYRKELAKSDQAAAAAREAADAARVQARDNAAFASIAAFHAALIDLSKTAMERARAGAENVQKAEAAVLALYTAALTVAFSVTEHPLPSRGVVPLILLGWALVWSTAYLAYLTKPKAVDKPVPTTDFEQGAMRRSVAFIKWSRSGALNRAYALRVSVIALAFGVALLPAPFVNFDPVNDQPAALPEGPAWPEQPVGGDAELNKIRYQAEINEVAELRKSGAPITDDGDDSTWWVACLVALLLSLALPKVFTFGDEDEPETGDDIPGPVGVEPHAGARPEGAD